MLLAVAALLNKAHSAWSGTLILLFQPNEELAGGAKAMVEDGLFDRVTKPDLLLAQHLHGTRTGRVAISPGDILTSVDSVSRQCYNERLSRSLIEDL